MISTGLYPVPTVPTVNGIVSTLPTVAVQKVLPVLLLYPTRPNFFVNLCSGKIRDADLILCFKIRNEKTPMFGTCTYS